MIMLEGLVVLACIGGLSVLIVAGMLLSLRKHQVQQKVPKRNGAVAQGNHLQGQ